LNYRVVFLRVFIKRFQRLHPRLRLQVTRRVQELAENPYLGVRLVGQLEGFWKDRVGKYRIIYKIDETKKDIVFYDVDLRKRVYR
jgi:mRNA interferase RelE/StbE